MLAIEVEYLLGRALATARNDRGRAEWPPHPARLFSALVAALYESDLDDDQRAAGRAALLWLERQPPPQLYVDPALPEGNGRTVLDTWVPVNPTRSEVGAGTKVPKAVVAEGLRLPRRRAERTFPAFVPNDPLVAFLWPEADPAEHGNALRRLAAELSYVGSSMSPVRGRLLDRPPAPTLAPAERGELALRVPGPGRLDRLDQCFDLSQELMRRIEAPLGRTEAYRVLREAGPGAPDRGIFRIGAVFRRAAGPQLPPEAGPALADAVRHNLMRVGPQPAPEVLSGHDAAGVPTREAHVAICPLLRAGDPILDGGMDPLEPEAIATPLAWRDPHADGSPKGVALLVPLRLTPEAREAVDLALRDLAQEPLLLGPYGEWRIERLTGAERGRPPKVLDERQWTRPSLHWATVTPVVFGHHPKPRRPDRDALAVLSRACEDAGLPVPERVVVGNIAAFRGVLPARTYHRIEHRRAQQLTRNRFVGHVRLRFPRPVAGPVVLGAGRFFGLGLCRPIGRYAEGWS